VLSIGELVGYVTLNTTGLKAGAAQTSATMKGLAAEGKAAGAATATGMQTGVKSGMGGMGSTMKTWGTTLGVLGAAAGVAASVNLEASFSKSMAQIGAATGAPQAELKKMADLAKKMGADTMFSSNDAADAMLELAKAGISTADIMGGSLKGTLTLAAAGGTDMATAATIASNAMNTFGLKGKDMDKVAAALAGGANASSASVESLGQALQQVGPGAKNAGLGLDETVAALAAFDSAGIKGSDAGTSLKTMLTNLIPQTKTASTAMQQYGLFAYDAKAAMQVLTAQGFKPASSSMEDVRKAFEDYAISLGLATKGSASMDGVVNKLMTSTGATHSAFVKTNGEFKSMQQIAGILQDKLGGLTQAQKSQALSQIFGSDATRAASVLVNEGAKGIGKYIDATNDMGAAQKMADANMSGTAGALEKMKGSLETAGLAFGQILAPAVQKGADAIAVMANAISGALGWMGQHKTTTLVLAGVIGALTAVVLAHNAAMALSAAGGMLQWLQSTKLISGATKVWTAVQWAFNAAMSANPLVLVAALLIALGVALYVAWTKSEKFREDDTRAKDPENNAGKAVGHWFSDTLPGLFGDAWSGAYHTTQEWGDTIRTWVKALPGKIADYLTDLPGKVGGMFASAFSEGKTRAEEKWADIKGWITGLPGKITSAADYLFNQAGSDLINAFVNGMKNASGIISGISGNVWDAVKGLINDAIDKLNAAFEFKIELPGPDIHVDLPNIPHLATGGRATAATLAVIGEGREPESVLPDSVLRGLLDKAHAAGMAMAGNGGGALIGTVVQQPGESADELAERLWYKTRKRG
jgi:TP901 family phage tail tape measure protein